MNQEFRKFMKLGDVNVDDQVKIKERFQEYILKDIIESGNQPTDSKLLKKKLSLEEFLNFKY